jgi:fructoselysine-6-P-deglycase FrlB-like protein
MESTPLLNEIRRQPEVLDELYQRRGELIKLIKPYLASQNAPFIYAFGCGDSRVSAETADAAFRSWSKLDYKALPALEFLAYQLSNLRQGDVVIPISMSGNVDRTVAGMRAAQARGARALALTNSSSGQLAQGADAVFFLNLNEPASFLSSTVSYSATLLSLFLISLEFSPGEQSSVAE